MSQQKVLFRLDVVIQTDRDPFEMANAVASFVQSALEDENPEQVGVIDVDVQDAEVLTR
jgi:hypothetical protein